MAGLVVQDAAVGLNVILVGAEGFGATHGVHLDAALTVTTSTFALVGLTINPVTHWRIPRSEAAGRDIIDDYAEAEALTTEWAVPDVNVDVFVVTSFVGPTVGLSPVNGPCDSTAPGMSGIVVELIPGYTGSALAHELGHYLGLTHVDDPANLMYPNVPNGGWLSSAQGNAVRRHCAVRSTEATCRHASCPGGAVSADASRRRPHSPERTVPRGEGGRVGSPQASSGGTASFSPREA